MSTLFNEELHCPVCHLQFCTGTGDPRVLKCGHCICTDCLKKHNFELHIECNECQSDARYFYIEELPVSYTIKTFISRLQERLSTEDTPKTLNDNITFSSTNENNNETLTSLGTCPTHSSPLHFGCLVCEEWLCGTCVCLKHNNKNCKVVLIQEAILKKKNELINYLEEFKNSCEKTKSDTKISIITTEELMSFIAKHISLDEKYLNELNMKQAELIIKEKYLKELDEVASDLEEKLNVSESPENLKHALNVYFGKKETLNKKHERNQLFETWKHWMNDSFTLLEKANDVNVRWEDWQSNKFLINLKTKSKEVIMTLTGEEEEDSKLIFEPSFFTYSSKLNHAFIELSYQTTGRPLPRVTFILDESPLAQEFMKCCCLAWSNGSFKNTMASCPSRLCNTFIFGEKEYQNSDNLINVGTRDRYLKPVQNGAIGIYNKFDDEEDIDINNMIIYVHMVSNEASLPQNLPYVSYGEEPKLKYCFGSAYSGTDYFEYSTSESLNSKMFVSECGVLADYISEDEEDY